MWHYVFTYAYTHSSYREYFMYTNCEFKNAALSPSILFCNTSYSISYHLLYRYILIMYIRHKYIPH